MVSVMHLVKSNLYWLVGKGEIHFWKERWFGGSRFADWGTPPESVKNITIREMILNIGNCLDACTGNFQSQVRSNIQNMAPLLCREEDKCLWVASPNGKFSISSAW